MIKSIITGIMHTKEEIYTNLVRVFRPEGIGMGFVLRDDEGIHIVTAEHVVEGQKVRVNYRDGRCEELKFTAIPKRDIAFSQPQLAADLQGVRQAENLRPGGRGSILTFDYHKGEFREYNGVISYAGSRDGVHFLKQCDQDPKKGMSGSPVIDEDGCVFGVHRGSLYPSTSVVYLLPGTHEPPRDVRNWCRSLLEIIEIRRNFKT